MPHFTLELGPGGPELKAVVGVSQPRAEALTQAGKPIPKAVAIRALVDTGASGTCIDPSVLKSLGLTATGSTLVHSPTTRGAAQPADQYDVSILIFGKATEPPLVVPSLAIMESELLVQGIQGLIGRDILCNCLLTYNGAVGTFTLAF